MGFLTRHFPAACSRLKIFICYGHDDRALAHEISQALTNAGHDVFVDANSLKAGGDFQAAIRDYISRADRFVFLASHHSLSPKAYPQTELGFAQERWPSPHGAVWPVIVDDDILPERLNVYLRSVQAYRPKGNLVADLTAAIDKSKRVKPWCWRCMGLAASSGAAALFFLAGNVGPTQVTLLTPQQVDFRPEQKPDDQEGWKDSDLALTLIPVNYVNGSGQPVDIMAETVLLGLGDRTVPFKWHNEVEMRPNCGVDWLCTKTSIGAATVAVALKRETMYLPATTASLTWRGFIEWVCTSSADQLEVKIAGQTRSIGPLGTRKASPTAICRIDLKDLRESLQAVCSHQSETYPLRRSPTCLP